MAVGSAFSKRVQIGKETTRGTAVAATAVLLPDQGGFSAQENRIFHSPVHERLSLSLYHADSRILAGIPEVDWSYRGDATYEQLTYFLSGAIETEAITGADPYVYTYAPSYVATNGQRTYTIEEADDLQGYEYEFAYVKSLQISGGSNAACKVSVSGGARQKTESTVTPALTAPAVEPIMGNKCQLYYGTSWSNLTGGGTLATATLLDWQVTVNSGLMSSKRTDGTDYFTLIGEQKRQLMQFAFTLEFNTITNATLDLSSDWQAGTQQWFEIRAAGTNSRALQIQMSCFIDNYSPGPPIDGINTIRISGGTQQDATGATEGQVILTNKTATLT